MLQKVSIQNFKSLKDAFAKEVEAALQAESSIYFPRLRTYFRHPRHSIQNKGPRLCSRQIGSQESRLTHSLCGSGSQPTSAPRAQPSRRKSRQGCSNGGTPPAMATRRCSSSGLRGTGWMRPTRDACRDGSKSPGISSCPNGVTY